MSKVFPPVSSAYVPTEYVTADKLVRHFAVDGIDSLPEGEDARYRNYAAQANKATETSIYKYIDTIPLPITDEARTYAEGMAFWYALWLKAIDDGAGNVTGLEKLWMQFRDDLIKVFQSQPKQSTKRSMVSKDFGDLATPYSQSYGLSDIL